MSLNRLKQTDDKICGSCSSLTKKASTIKNSCTNLQNNGQNWNDFNIPKQKESLRQRDKRNIWGGICNASVLKGIQQSAFSQNMAWRDHLTDTFITDKMTGNKTHGLFQTTLLDWKCCEYWLKIETNLKMYNYL